MTEFLLYLPLGIIAGFCAGLFGVGGGVIIVPFLMVAFELFSMDASVMTHLAVGTSLACVVPTAASSTWAHHKKKGVIWSWVLKLAPFLILGGLLGGWTADQLTGEMLTIILSVFLFLMACRLFIKSDPLIESEALKIPSNLHFGLIGTLMGWISSMMGIAGGALAVPFMAAHGSGMRRAVGTSAALGVPTAASGAVAFLIMGIDHPNRPEWSIGYIYLPAFLGIVLSSTIVARLGAHFAHSVDQSLLQRLFACFLAVLSIRLIWNVAS